MTEELKALDEAINWLQARCDEAAYRDGMYYSTIRTLIEASRAYADLMRVTDEDRAEQSPERRRWQAKKARTLIHISCDGAPVCEVSVSANHVHEDYPGCKRDWIKRQEQFAETIVKACNALAAPQIDGAKRDQSQPVSDAPGLEKVREALIQGKHYARLLIARNEIENIDNTHHNRALEKMEQALAILGQQAAPDSRSCTCHPSEATTPCAKRYAASDCNPLAALRAKVEGMKKDKRVQEPLTMGQAIENGRIDIHNAALDAVLDAMRGGE